MASSSTNTPCAACKFLRRKCTQECVFAPYFPPDQPQKFASVHKVFGASNVGKLLADLPPSEREEAAVSLAYEAQERLRDPIYGCVGHISILQQQLKQNMQQLESAKRELASYVGPTALLPINHPHNFLQQMHASASSVGQPFGMPTVGPSIPTPAGPSSQGGVLLDEQQQQTLETQVLASALAAAREQEMLLLRNYEQQQQQQQHQELARFNSVLEGIGGGQIAQGFNQMNPASPSTLAFGPYDNSFLAQQQQRTYLHQQDPQHQQRHEHQFLRQQHQQSDEHQFLQQQNPQHQQRDEHQFLQQQNPQHQQREEHQFLQQQNPQHQQRDEHQFLQQQRDQFLQQQNPQHQHREEHQFLQQQNPQNRGTTP